MVGSNGPAKGPPQGPSQAELILIQGISRELCISMPGLSDDDAMHFAVESVKEQPRIAQSTARMVADIAKGKALWLRVLVRKTTSSPIETGKTPETVAVFQGPSRPGKSHTPMQIVGAAVARSLTSSAFARALLYANGMRLEFKIDASPVRAVEGE